MITMKKYRKWMMLFLVIVLLGTDSAGVSAAEMIVNDTTDSSEDSLLDETGSDETPEMEEIVIEDSSDIVASDSSEIVEDTEVDSAEMSDVEEPESEESLSEEESEEISEEYDINTEVTEEEIIAEKLAVQETVLAELSSAVAGQDYVANEVVNLCETVKEAEAVAKAYNLQLKSYEEGVAVYTITDKTQRVFDIVTESADTTNNVSAVYPNYYRKIATTETSVNPSGIFQTDVGWDDMQDPYINKQSPYFQWYHLLLNTANNWSNDLNKEFTIAIFDTGIVTDSEFDASMTMAIDAINSTNGAVDTDGHGSSIAGMIAGVGDNNKYGRGLRPGQSIISVKIAEKVTDLIPDNIILTAAYNMIDREGVCVLDFSFGGYFRNPLYDTMIDDAYNKGILVVAPVGDDGVCGDFYPAACDGVIGVSSINSSFKKSSFSNYGSMVDMCAPGGDVIYETGNSQLCRYEYICGFGQKCYYGTAEAAACVAAATAINGNNVRWSIEYTPARLYQLVHSLGNPQYFGRGNITYKLTAACPRIKIVEKSNQIYLQSDSAYTQAFEQEFMEFYYTLDGSTPSRTNGTRVKSQEVLPIIPTYQSVVLKAIGYVGIANSDVVTQSYNINQHYGTGYCDAIRPKDSRRSNQIAVGKTLQLTADYDDYFGKIKWFSENNLIATVSSTGVVTAKKAGLSTNIYAECGTAKVTYRVYVTPVPEKYEFNIVDQMYAGNTSYVSLVSDACVPESMCKVFTLSSSNSNIIRVEDNQMVAIKSGKVTIIATLMDGSNKKFSKTIEVIDQVNSIQIREKNDQDGCVAGQKLYPYIAINYTKVKVKSQDYFWTVTTDDSGLVSIDSKTGVISVRNDKNFVTSTQVTVNAVHKTNPYLNDSFTFTLYPKTKQILSDITDYTMCANIGTWGSISQIYGINSAPVDAQDEFIYTCSDKKVMALDNTTGQFRILKPGKVTLTVKANDGSNIQKKLYLTIEMIPSAVGVNANPSTYRLVPGTSIQMKADASHDANNKYIVWDVCNVEGNSDTTYATISKAGKLQVDRNLELDRVQIVYVKATWQFDIDHNGTIQNTEQVSTTIPVEIYPIAQGLQTQEQTISVYTTEKKKWIVSAIPEAACQKFEYSSSNTKIANIDRYGIITGYTGGSVTLTARATDGSNKKITCKCTILKCSVVALKGSKYIAEGSSRAITLDSSYQKGVNCKTITYDIVEGYDEYASVSSDGVLTAAPGSAGKQIKVMLSTPTVDSIITYDVFDKVEKISFADGFGEKAVPMGYYKNQKSITRINIPLEISEGVAPLKLSTSNNKIAQVYYDTQEKVYKLGSGIKKGTATITLETLDGSNIKKTFKVNNLAEKPLYLYSIEMKTGQEGLCAGKSVQMVADTNIKEATHKQFAYEITGDGTNYATITKSGYVTAKAGITEKTEITVKATALDEFHSSASTKITLYPKATSIVRNGEVSLQTTIKVSAYESLYLILASKDQNGSTENTCQKFTYTSSNKKVAMPDANSNGKIVTYGKSGTAYVTATLNDGSGLQIKFKIVVYSPVTYLDISQKEGQKTLIAGSKMKLDAVTNENADNKKVIWSSNDENLLKVDQNGVVTAMDVDSITTCTIKAQSAYIPENGGIRYSCNYSIKIIPKK